MSVAAPQIGIGRMIVAVLGALALFSLLTQQLEYTLVNAVGGDTVKDTASYMAVLTRPWILVLKVVLNVLLALLAGYVTARIAGAREVPLAGIAAAAVTVTLALGLVSGPYAALPLWIRLLLLVTTGPAMVAGAWVRMQARLAMESTPAPPAAVGPTPGPNAGRERP